MDSRLPQWFRQSLLVARVEFRREFRRVRSSSMVLTLQFSIIVIGTFWMVGSLPLPGYGAVWGQPGAYEFGSQFGSDPEPVVELARGTAGVLMILVAYGVTLRILTDSETKELLLLACTPRSTGLGVILFQALYTGCLVAPIVVGGAVAFAVGAGAPLAAVTILYSAALAYLLTVAVGGVVALATLSLLGKGVTSRRWKVVVGAPLAAGYFALFIWSRRAVGLLADSPLSWFGDLALLGVGHDTPLAVIAALSVATGAALVAAVVVTPPLARLAWLDADAEPDSGTTAGADTTATVGESDSSRTVALVERVASRPTAAVVRTCWRRATREPRTLLFALIPVALVGSVANELVGIRPGSLPLLVAIYGSVAVGMGPSLNLLGNESTSLPLVLSTPGGRRSLLRGYLLAAWLPGALVVAAATLLAGTLTTLPASVVAGTALLGVLLAATAVSVSLCLGVFMPEWDGISATSTTSFQFPRIEAVGLLSIVLSLLGGPALVGGFWAEAVAEATGLAAELAVAVGVGSTVLGAVVAGIGSYLVAARRLDDDGIDQLA